MVKSFDNSLEEIKSNILSLSKIIYKQIESCSSMINALNPEEKAKLIEKINKNEDIIDQTHDSIDKKITLFIATRQPVALDLRELMASVRISHDLERIGDEIESITKKEKYITRCLDQEDSKDFISLLNLVTMQLKKCMTAYKKYEHKNATKIWINDEEIDNKYYDLVKQIVKKFNANDKSKNLINVMFALKSAERAADHITNICESIHYMVTGFNLKK